MTTILIIQYNPKWITKLKIPVKKYPKKGKFFCGKIKKKRKTGLFFALFAIQKMAYLSPKIRFIQEVGKIER